MFSNKRKSPLKVESCTFDRVTPFILVLFVGFFVQVFFYYKVSVICAPVVLRCFVTSSAFTLVFCSVQQSRLGTAIGALCLVAWGVVVAFSVTYYEYFLSLPSTSMIKLIPQGGSVFKFAVSLGRSDQIAIVMCVTLCAALVWIRRNKLHRFGHPAALVLLAIALFTINWGYIGYLNMSRPVKHDLAHDYVGIRFYYNPMEALKNYGYLPYLYYRWRFLKDDLVYDSPLDNPNPLRRESAHTPNSKDIIVIQVESLDHAILGRKSNGYEITPYLNQLRKDAIYYPKFYAVHGVGGSSDAEFASITGILPSHRSPTMPFFDLSHLPSVSKTLNSNGYTCVAMHGNTGKYWNRVNAYSQLGFDRFFDEHDYTGLAKGFNSLDSEFLMQSLEYLRGLKVGNSQLFAYLITQTMHGPYSSPQTHQNRKFYQENDQVLDYFRVANYTDLSLFMFMNHLRNDPLLKMATVIIFGDHTSALNEDEYSSMKEFGENVPLFILTPEGDAKVVHTYGSHIDIAPTITTLTGITPDERWYGRSMIEWHSDRLFPIATGETRFIIHPNGIHSVSDWNQSIYKKVVSYSDSFFSKTIPITVKVESNKLLQIPFVAQAMGNVNGLTYTNSLEAFYACYNKGLRYFEVNVSYFCP